MTSSLGTNFSTLPSIPWISLCAAFDRPSKTTTAWLVRKMLGWPAGPPTIAWKMSRSRFGEAFGQKRHGLSARMASAEGTIVFKSTMCTAEVNFRSSSRVARLGLCKMFTLFLAPQSGNSQVATINYQLPPRAGSRKSAGVEIIDYFAQTGKQKNPASLGVPTFRDSILGNLWKPFVAGYNKAKDAQELQRWRWREQGNIIIPDFYNAISMYGCLSVDLLLISIVKLPRLIQMSGWKRYIPTYCFHLFQLLSNSNVCWNKNPNDQSVGLCENWAPLNPFINHQYPGWWLTYPPEKYDFVSWDDEIPNWMESHNPVMFQTTNHQYPIELAICWVHSDVSS